MDSNIRPARAISPGRVILRELEERGWSQQDLAEIIDRPEQAISEIIRAKKQITAETARQLAKAFGTSIDFWLNLEMNYQLALAEKQAQESEIELKSKIYDLVPVNELLKRGWIQKTKTIANLKIEVCRYYQVLDINAIPSIQASLRNSPVRNPEERSKIAWLQRVKLLASEQRANRFEVEKLDQVIEGLLSFSQEIENIRNIPGFLLDHGIHFVLVKNLPKTYIDGAALWLEKNPVIALSLRYDRIDAFWFTLFHELAHIKYNHNIQHLDELYATSNRKIVSNKEEIRANTFAQSCLIDDKVFRYFIDQNKPRYSRSSVETFAQEQKRHPGIVVGQLMYRKEIKYSNLREYLEKVSPNLNGWVDVPQPI